MKKTIFITIGILILLLIVGVWGYLFLYGAPKNSSEVFTNFGFGGNENAPEINTNSTVDVQTTTNEGSRQKLKQLTTGPVAGATFITGGIRYVEQGTGHVYDIDLTSGTESLINGTTLPQSADAVFAKDGSHVAITAYTPSGNRTILQKLEKDQQGNSPAGVGLPLGAREIYFGDSTSTLMYLLEETTGSSGYSYSLRRGTGTQVFKIALRDIHVLWGSTNYVYTTPTSLSTGQLYRVSGSDLQYVTKGGLGLTGSSYGNGLIITTTNSSGIISTALNKSGKAMDLPLSVIPEKCAWGIKKKDTIYCSVPTNLTEGVFPDDWYKGSLSYSDILWEIKVENAEATMLSGFLTESGREIDVSKIGTDNDGTLIYFINKNDNTLWMFDTTL